MIRKIGTLFAGLVLALSFAAAKPNAVMAITCDDIPPYAVFYVDGSGGGGRLTLCSTDSYSSLSSTWNDKFSSVYVYIGGASKVPCAFSNSAYQGAYAKFFSGQHGFTWFQWPYMDWDTGGGMDNQISSIKWCNP